MARKKGSLNKKTKVEREIADIKDKYSNIEYLGTEQGDQDGQYKVFFKAKALAYLPSDKQPIGIKAPEALKSKMKMRASIRYKDALTRSDLDLASPSVVNQSPATLYERVKGYYRSVEVFGTYIDILVNFSAAGFVNDCEDPKIKEFYDNWVQDVDLTQVIQWILQEFFTTGFVRTYRVFGPYEPGINILPKMKNPPTTKSLKKEQAAKKKKWASGYIPVAYTILNPSEIELKGSPLFNQTRVVLKPSEDLVELVKKEDTTTPLTYFEKIVLDNIPSDIKAAAKTQKEIEIDPIYIGAIDYRKMPYELYPIPKGARAMSALDYKKALIEADYSTIDGITSEILIITVGDKDYPVTDPEELETVADLFDTAQKAYQVIWNHTLKVERVPMQNVSEIFGISKFEQVERDITGSFGVARAFVDGIMTENAGKDALSLATKSLIAEIMYARSQVERWLYGEYSDIAESYGFDQFPQIRWNELLLRDEIAVKTLIMGLVDRRIISYETAIKMLDLNSAQEKSLLSSELKDVVAGKYGLRGSPFQQTKDGIQPTQMAPEGTPSSGRPAEPAPKTPAPATPEGKTKEVIKKSKEKSSLDIKEMLEEIPLEELVSMERILGKIREKREKELNNLVSGEEAGDLTSA